MPLLAILLFSLLASGPLGTDRLVAQTAPSGSEDPGRWWSVSLQAGGSRLTCDLCDRSRDLGPGLAMAIGSYAGPDTRIGLSADVWTHREGDVRETVYGLGLTGDIRPWAGRGFHVVAGAGWAGYRVEDFRYDAVRLRVGAGWDLPLDDTWTVGNRVTLDASSFASLHSGDAEVVGSVGLSVVRFEIFVRHR